LLPAHLDAWAQTSQRPAADPDIALWLHGDAEPSADVQVIWRGDDELAKLELDGAVERVVERLLVCRPSALEAVTVPLAAARRWLTEGTADPISDVEGAVEDEARMPRRRLAPPRLVLRWRGEDSDAIVPDDLRPGDTVIVDANTAGGMSRGTFDPTSKEPVTDLGDLAQLRARGVATLRLTRDALAVWQLSADHLAALPDAELLEEPDALETAIDDWLNGWRETPGDAFLGTPKEWDTLRSALQSSKRRIAVLGDTGSRLVVVTAPTNLPAEVDDAVTEDEDSSFRRTEVSLAQHSCDVRDLVKDYARSLGFDAKLQDDLALAAWLHDTGKADPRFQRWLTGGVEQPGGPSKLLAKSALSSGRVRERRLARERSGYPAGTRHELLSLAMAQASDALGAANDRDLVLHLVASHHGWCRPFPPPVLEPEDLQVSFQHGTHTLAAATRHNLARLDSDVAPRFWRLVSRYGWWGLAWLEAVLRLADHRASEQSERAS
jgi:CRISPR-associated endonuclease/helicase Cas3